MSEQKLTVGELIYKISGDMDNLKTELQKSEASIKKLEDAMEQTNKMSNKLTKGFNAAANAIKGFVAGFAIKQIVDFGRAAVQVASQRLEQETKLAQVLRTSQNATDAQIQSVLDQADALEKVGVIGKDVITASQAQLATYDLTTDSIKALTPALLDYLAAEKGASATKEDAIGLTNGLAQAIQGNYGSLSRTGFILDEATKKLIENGTQAQRVQAITEVLNSTYKDYNKTLANTFLGTQVRAIRVIDDFKEDLGFALMPTIQMLTGELLKFSGGLESGTPRINDWGKKIYQATNFVISMAKAFVLVIKSLTAFGDIIYQSGKVVFNFSKNTAQYIAKVQTGFSSLGEGIMKIFKGDFSGALETFKKDISTTFGDYNSSMEDFNNATVAWSGILKEAFDDVGNSAVQAFDATDFKPVTAEALTAYDAMKKAQDGFAEASESSKKEAAKAAKAVEDFQGKLLSLIDSSKSVSKELNENLAAGFKKFSEEVKGNFQDTVSSLATITVKAQDTLKDLKKQLADANNEFATSMSKETDYSRRQTISTEFDTNKKDLERQIKEQESILESREGFEARQAERIKAIRQKLTDAGIDADKAGINSLTTARTLEEQIAEERRIASLDEFKKFEEEQSKKLAILTDAFITETKLTKTKIETQKSYEAELTSYLQSEDSKRLKNTDTWANATIAKYKEVADSLKSVVSTQSQLKGLAPSITSPVSIPTNPQSTPAVSGGTTTNNNVSAPVTINGTQIQNMSPKELSAILGFELNKFIR